MDRTAEIIARLKTGEIDEAEAQGLLDEDIANTESRDQRREIPVGLFGADGVVVDAEQEQSVMLTLVNSLPPRQAQCVELYYFDGYTQEQIAERLGIGQRTVSGYLEVARGKMRNLVTADPLKSPSHRFIYGETNHSVRLTDLMRDNIRKQKRTSVPFFPFEMWLRYNAGARWTRYNEYRPIIENRLHEYLCDCFAVPPVVGASTGRRKR
jgi:predicted transcriptional regulator